MLSEKEKMLSERLYHPLDKILIKEREKTRKLLRQLNSADTSEKKRSLIQKLIPNGGQNAFIEPPFYCDYGTNIILNGKVFFNFDCVILDTAEVSIGKHVFIGPKVQIYTAQHPMDYRLRRTLQETAQRVKIGNDVWIGGGVIICPGVTIGARSVIGAGSVLTKDIPEDVFAAGNPCEIIRKL